MGFETARLRVRPFEPSDASPIFSLSQEPGVQRFLPDQVYRDQAHAGEVLEFLIGCYAEPAAPGSGIYVQAVELLQSGELIGHVGLSPAGELREIGYAIASAHQGQGYATELVLGTLRWAGELGEGALLGIVASDNFSSCRVLEKAGFRLVEERARELHGVLQPVRTYRAEIAALSG